MIFIIMYHHNCPPSRNLSSSAHSSLRLEGRPKTSFPTSWRPTLVGAAAACVACCSFVRSARSSGVSLLLVHAEVALPYHHFTLSTARGASPRRAVFVKRRVDPHAVTCRTASPERCSERVSAAARRSGADQRRPSRPGRWAGRSRAAARPRGELYCGGDPEYAVRHTIPD